MGACTHTPDKMAWTYPPLPMGGVIKQNAYESTFTAKELFKLQAPRKPAGEKQDSNTWKKMVPRDSPTNHLPKRVLEFQWPAEATGLTGLFGMRRDPINGKRHFHYGIDLPISYGAPIFAAESGRVVWARWSGGHGYRVIIQHSAGYKTSYSHLSTIDTQHDHWIEQGKILGRAGTSGRTTGPHLHFELSKYGQHLDPLEFLGTEIVQN